MKQSSPNLTVHFTGEGKKYARSLTKNRQDAGILCTRQTTGTADELHDQRELSLQLAL